MLEVVVHLRVSSDVFDVALGARVICGWELLQDLTWVVADV